VVLIEGREIVWVEHITQLKKVRRALEGTVNAVGDENAVGGLEVLIVEIIDVVNATAQGSLESRNISVL